MNFLCGFLGELALNNTRLFLQSQIQDKNGHDGILWKMHNKRLIVGSEFKPDMKLDVSMLKKLTGMDPICGRYFGKESDFDEISRICNKRKKEKNHKSYPLIVDTFS